MSFHAFGQCFHLFIDRAISKLPITENRIEKLLLVRFLLSFLFKQMVEKLHVPFGPHCIISVYTQDYESKFSKETNFDTLVSNLKFYL